MAAEFVVLGRHPLPAGDAPWELAIEGESGGVDVYEAVLRYDLAEVQRRYADALGWAPVSIVFVRKAWERAQVVAEELASAIEGAVVCDVDDEVIFDARGNRTPASSRSELAARLERAFAHPEPFFERWRAEESRQSVAGSSIDWSDVE